MTAIDAEGPSLTNAQKRAAQRAAKDLKDNIERSDTIALYESSLLALRQEWDDPTTDWRRQRTIELEMRMLQGRIEALENSRLRALPKEERDRIKRERKALKFAQVVDVSDLPVNTRGPSAIVEALATLEGYRRDFLIAYFSIVTGHIHIPLQARNAFD